MILILRHLSFAAFRTVMVALCLFALNGGTSVFGADSTIESNSGATVPANAVASSSQQESQRTFFIKKYRITGASGVLNRGEMEDAVYPYLGPGRTADDVQKACKAIEKAYQAKGYQTVSVQIPPQHVQNGVIVLQVVEEKINRLRVKGARYYTPSEIKSEAPSMAEGTLPNFNYITSDIVGLNQQPDRRVTPEIHASETPGMVDVDLNVKDTPPLHGSIELNNRYSQGTTPLRLVSNVSYDNLWQMGHSVNLTYQIAPENPNDAQVFSGSYLARIPEPDLAWLSFLISGVHSDSNVATVGGINVVGKGDTAGIRAVITLPTLRETGFYHSFSFGLDYKKFDQKMDLGDGQPIDTPITYYPFTAGYNATLQDKSSTTQFGSSVVFGVDGMGSSPSTFDTKGFGTQANYIYLKGNIARTQNLPEDFQAYGNIQYQFADEPLVSSEQMSGGGLDTIRGYFESEVTGDNGAIGQFEMRTPSLSKWLGSEVNEWRFYAFGDAGILSINKPLPEVESQFKLASIGAGTRLRLADYLNGSLDMGIPILAGPQTTAVFPDFVFTFKVSVAY